MSWRAPLVFLRLVDEHDGNLSLTNIAVMVVLGLVVKGGSATAGDLGALLTVLGLYFGKKVLCAKAAKDEGRENAVVIDDRPGP